MFINPGPQELLVVGIIALLLFGKRLPEVARNLGKGFSEFKKGMSGMQDEIHSASSTADQAIEYTPPGGSTDSNRPTVEDDEDDEFKAPKFEIDDK